MGPPGVGKSTIFAAACAARNGSRLFYRFDEIEHQSGSGSCWDDFASLVVSAYGACPCDDPIHARRLKVTLRAIKRARKIDAAAGDAVVLVDESLCQRGLSLALSKPNNDDRYFQRMPAPAAVVAITADCATIEARNLERSKQGGTDRSIDTQATLSECGIAVLDLKQRGVEVLEIDGSKSVDENVAALCEFLTGI